MQLQRMAATSPNLPFFYNVANVEYGKFRLSLQCWICILPNWSHTQRNAFNDPPVFLQVFTISVIDQPVRLKTIASIARRWLDGVFSC